MKTADTRPDATLMTVGDVAKRGDVSTDLVRYWERQGMLPALKTIGGRRIFQSGVVDRFLEQRRKIGPR